MLTCLRTPATTAMGLDPQCLLASEAVSLGCHPSGRLVPFAPRFPPPQRLSTQARRVLGYAVDSQNGATLEKDNTVRNSPRYPWRPCSETRERLCVPRRA